MFTGPASHAHPVASKRPPAPTPGHYADAHPDLLERILPVPVRWAGSLRMTERPVNHGGSRGSLPPLAPTHTHVHARVPTHSPVTRACGRCRHPSHACGGGYSAAAALVLPGDTVVGAWSTVSTVDLSVQHVRGLGAPQPPSPRAAMSLARLSVRGPGLDACPCGAGRRRFRRHAAPSTACRADLPHMSRQQRCCCLLLQYLIQSCARGGRRIVEDMCYEIRRAEACVD